MGKNRTVICLCSKCSKMGGRQVYKETEKDHRKRDTNNPTNTQNPGPNPKRYLCKCPKHPYGELVAKQTKSDHMKAARRSMQGNFSDFTPNSQEDDTYMADLDESNDWSSSADEDIPTEDTIENDFVDFMRNNGAIEPDIDILDDDFQNLRIPNFWHEIEDDEDPESDDDGSKDDWVDPVSIDMEDFTNIPHEDHMEHGLEGELEWFHGIDKLSRESYTFIKEHIHKYCECDKVPTPPIYRLPDRLAKKSGITHTFYDCCENSCMAFTGEDKELTQCLECGADRYYQHRDQNGNRKSKKQWKYIHLTPRLKAQYSWYEQAEKLQTYRVSRHCESGVYSDVFDGDLYRDYHLAKLKLFQKPTDIALEILLDGFVITNMKTWDTTPVILINLNLPPSERYKIENIMASFIIPGPRKYRNLNSFLRPLIDEMKDLDKGVPGCYNRFKDCVFTLHAWLLLCAADGPASADACGLKRPGGALTPCHQCLIRGVTMPKKAPSESSTANVSTAVNSNNPSGSAKPPKTGSNTHYYLPHTDELLSNPPMRTSLRRIIDLINRHTVQTKREELRQCWGVSSKSILTELPSMHFPRSFPMDIMHCILSNITKDLFTFWTGKGIQVDIPEKRPHNYQDSSTLDSYILDKNIRQEIGQNMYDSKANIPSSLGHAPRNIDKHSAGFKAKEWQAWLTTYGPPLLVEKLPKPYFENFMFLREIYLISTQYSVTPEDITKLAELSQRFIKSYERCYYRGDPYRLQVCKINVHSILHLAQHTKDLGPARYYWAFPMERYIGFIKPKIRSKSHMDANLSNQVMINEHLNHLPRKYIVESLSAPFGEPFKSSKTPITTTEMACIRAGLRDPDLSQFSVQKFTKLALDYDFKITSFEGQPKYSMTNRDNSVVVYQHPRQSLNRFGRIMAFFRVNDNLSGAIIQPFEIRTPNGPSQIVYHGKSREYWISTSCIKAPAGILKCGNKEVLVKKDFHDI